MKLPNPEKTEVFVMRLSKSTKTKLEELAKKPQFGGNNSAVVRFLIEAEHLKKL